MDKSLEQIPGNGANTNGYLLYTIEAKCGYFFPCSDKELTCVVVLSNTKSSTCMHVSTIYLCMYVCVKCTMGFLMINKYIWTKYGSMYVYLTPNTYYILYLIIHNYSYIVQVMVLTQAGIHTVLPCSSLN